MFELENSYFDITSRFWRFCQMWYFGYHGFEAITQLSTGRNGMRTFNMVRVHTDCLSRSQGIPPSCSSKRLRSWIFFRHFYPVPRVQVRVEALHDMPKNVLTYTLRHVPRVLLTRSMSPKQKMVSPMRSAATWRSGTSRCRNLNGRSVELISPVIKCFCAACIDPQCRSIKCTSAVTKTDLTPFDSSCLFQYTNGQTSTTWRKRSSETYFRIDLGETIEYGLIWNTINRGYTLTKWTRVNWMNSDDSWTSYIHLAELDHPESILSGLPADEESKW